MDLEFKELLEKERQKVEDVFDFKNTKIGRGKINLNCMIINHLVFVLSKSWNIAI